MARRRKAQLGLIPSEHEEQTEEDVTPYVTIRVRRDLARKIATITTICGGNAAELVDPLLRPGVLRMYAEAIRQAAEQLNQDG